MQRLAARVPSIPIGRGWPWLALLLVAAGAAGVSIALEPGGGDLSAYWQAGHRVLVGASAFLPGQLAGPFPPYVPRAYFYPPPLAIAIAGLRSTGLDFDAFRIGWNALSAVGLLAAAILGLRAGGATRIAVPIAAALVTMPLWWYPEHAMLIDGNVGGILALGMAAAIVPGTLGGVGTALATLVKLTPGTLVPAILVGGRRGAIALVATLAIGLIVSLVVVPADTLATPAVLANLSAGGTGGLYDYGPAATATLLFGDGAATAGRLVGLAGMVALVAWSVVAARAGRWRTAVVAGTWATLLVSGTVWEHYLVIVLLPVGLAWPGATWFERLVVVASLAAGHVSFLDEITTHLLIWEWVLALAIVSLRAAIRLDADSSLVKPAASPVAAT